MDIYIYIYIYIHTFKFDKMLLRVHLNTLLLLISSLLKIVCYCVICGS